MCQTSTRYISDTIFSLFLSMSCPDRGLNLGWKVGMNNEGTLNCVFYYGLDCHLTRLLAEILNDKLSAPSKLNYNEELLEKLTSSSVYQFRLTGLINELVNIMHTSRGGCSVIILLQIGTSRETMALPDVRSYSFFIKVPFLHF